jgi:hypothetical protein
MQITDEEISQAIAKAEAASERAGKLLHPTIAERIKAFFRGRDIRREAEDAQFGAMMACFYVDELLEFQRYNRKSASL